MEDWAQGFSTKVWEILPISNTFHSSNWQLYTVYCEHKFCHNIQGLVNMYKILEIQKTEAVINVLCAVSFLFHNVLLASLQ